MVLKRCIYGVDKNRLTVELAKVSLWLHSFTVGAPLSFLDHHLRCGDSLVGLRVRDATDELHRLGGMFASSAITGAETATDGMQRIEEISDADVAEVQESAVLFDGVEETTADLRGLLDFLCGWRWLTAGMKKKERDEFEGPLVTTLSQHTANAYELLAHGPEEMGVADDTRFAELWRAARTIANRESFLHWEVAFPGVWHRWQESRPQGGFDAVIGNPPWDRIKLQEVEWFATRDRELALAPTAAARRKGIQRLRDQGASLAAEFDAAKAQAESLSHVVRSGGDYPLLSGGDINLYSLFVERSMSLIKPDGFVGLLTPSGIYADKTAARFFQSVSTSGRVGGLFDFENRRLGTDLPPFFPDVDSRFKFCALILGGEERQFDQTECAFFLHDTETVHDEDRCFPLTPDDFARVNPNTGTAPIFRSRRDAEITRRIYEQHPVLVDHSQGKEKRVWPVKYTTMFHMTNDSNLFETAEQLNAKGCYPVEGNRWKKGEELYLPLYQGRMIHQFDHRANSVRFNPKSTHNPYLSEEVTEAQHADPDFLPQTQYWVPANNVEEALPQSRGYTLGFRDIARPTDERTVIASMVPWAGVGNKVPLLVEEDNKAATYLVANLKLRLSRLRCTTENSRDEYELVHRRTTPRHRPHRLRPPLRRDDCPRPRPRPRPPPHVHRPRHGPLRPRPRLRRRAFHLGRRGTPPPPRPPRRPLLPPLRPVAGRRRIHPRHLPHRSPQRRSRLRNIPHPRYDAGVYECTSSRGYGDEGGGVDRPRCGSARSGSASSDNPLGAALKFGRMQPSLANTGPACRMAGVRGCGRLF